MCVCVRARVTAHVQTSEDRWKALVLSCSVGSGDQTQLFRLGSRPFTSLSHLAGIVCSFYFFMLGNCCLGIGALCFLVILNNSASKFSSLGNILKYLLDIFLEFLLFESLTFSYFPGNSSTLLKLVVVEAQFPDQQHQLHLESFWKSEPFDCTSA